MTKLIAISPMGKNGQTVVPAAIRRMFKMGAGRTLVGFYSDGKHVEIAPVSVVREEVDYTAAELDKLEALGREKGGRKFKGAHAAKRFLKGL